MSAHPAVHNRNSRRRLREAAQGHRHARLGSDCEIYGGCHTRTAARVPPRSMWLPFCVDLQQYAPKWQSFDLHWPTKVVFVCVFLCFFRSLLLASFLSCTVSELICACLRIRFFTTLRKQLRETQRKSECRQCAEFIFNYFLRFFI